MKKKNMWVFIGVLILFVSLTGCNSDRNPPTYMKSLKVVKIVDAQGETVIDDVVAQGMNVTYPSIDDEFLSWTSAKDNSRKIYRLRPGDRLE